MPTVLFLCPDGAARGPMAEALARHLRPEVEAWSAAWAPGHVRKPARQVLQEVGVDVRGLRARGILEVDAREIDVVVVLSNEPGCPVLPTRWRRVDLPMPDPDSAPAIEQMEAYRDCRDALERMLPRLLADHF